MKAVFAAAVAVLVMGAATSAIADGEDSGGSMPAVAPDSDGSGDGWGVASSAGVTYADTPGDTSGAVVDASTGQTVGQNYQVLDPNVVEYTQLVAGGAVMTLSGVLLQRDGDDSDAAQLDEEASGVYSSGSATLAPSLYDAVATIGGAMHADVACASGCDPLVGSDGSGAPGPVKTLASYASSESSNLLSSTSIASIPSDPSVFNPGAYIPQPPPVILVPPPSSGGGVGEGGGGAPGGQTPPPPDPPGGDPGNGVGSGGGLGPPGAVPEPAVWAMMLIGFGAIGAARRRLEKARASA